MYLTSRSIEKFQPKRQNLTESKRIKLTKEKIIIAKTLDAFNLKTIYDSKWSLGYAQALKEKFLPLKVDKLERYDNGFKKTEKNKISRNFVNLAR